MWSGRDHAGGPAGPVLAGGADGPGGVGREVGHWDRLDAARQRISTCKELQARTGSGGDLRSVLVDTPPGTGGKEREGVATVHLQYIGQVHPALTVDRDSP